VNRSVYRHTNILLLKTQKDKTHASSACIQLKHANKWKQLITVL